MEEVKKYCLDDVRITKDLYDYALHQAYNDGLARGAEIAEYQMGDQVCGTCMHSGAIESVVTAIKKEMRR